MDKRIVLSQNIKLFDENNNEFIVHIKNGSEEYGGSVLSYQVNLDQTTGRLKEYYPYELSEFIERNDEGYLFINEVLSDKINEFQKGRERYLNAYQTLLEKINEKKDENEKDEENNRHRFSSSSGNFKLVCRNISICR